MAQARAYPGQEQQVFEMFQKQPELQAQLRAPIFEDKVVDFIVELAQVKENKVSVEELMRDPDEQAEEKPKKKAAKKPAAKKATAKKPAEKKAPAKKAEPKKAAAKKPAAKKAAAKKTTKKAEK